MQTLETLIRSRQTRDTSPARRTSSVKCDDIADTVNLVFGKGGQGRIFTITYSIAVKRYMTKQQKEICLADPNVSVDDLGNPIDPSVNPEQ
jgi:hypothetical protein